MFTIFIDLVHRITFFTKFYSYEGRLAKALLTLLLFVNVPQLTLLANVVCVEILDYQNIKNNRYPL